MTNWPIPARIALCVLVALILGGGVGFAYHLANPHMSLPLVMAVFIPWVGIIPAVATYWLIWPSPKLRAAQRRNEHSVERQWLTDSAADAFWWLLAGMILCVVFGNLFSIGWLAPVGLVQVLVVAALSFGIPYLVRRIRGV